MNKTKFCEALYASYGDAVECRRRNFIAPAVILLAGICMLVANSALDGAGDYRDDIKATLVLAGSVAVIVGFVFLMVRIFGHGEPYHKGLRRFLKSEIVSFDRADANRVLDAVSACDYAALMSIPHRSVSAVTVLVYSTPGREFVAMQPFEYAELEYRPLCDMKVREA